MLGSKGKGVLTCRGRVLARTHEGEWYLQLGHSRAQSTRARDLKRDTRRSAAIRMWSASGLAGGCRGQNLQPQPSAQSHTMSSLCCRAHPGRPCTPICRLHAERSAPRCRAIPSAADAPEGTAVGSRAISQSRCDGQRNTRDSDAVRHSTVAHCAAPRIAAWCGPGWGDLGLKT